MVTDKHFSYYSTLTEINIQYWYPVYVDNIKFKKDIFDQYKHMLNFPEYFGYNWDAFNDCLSRIDEWIPYKNIVIINRDNIFLTEKDFSIYITVLYDMCELWEKYPDVLEIKVYFPLQFKQAIQGILKTINCRF